MSSFRSNYLIAEVLPPSMASRSKPKKAPEPWAPKRPTKKTGAKVLPGNPVGEGGVSNAPPSTSAARGKASKQSVGEPCKAKKKNLPPVDACTEVLAEYRALSAKKTQPPSSSARNSDLPRSPVDVRPPLSGLSPPMVYQARFLSKSNYVSPPVLLPTFLIIGVPIVLHLTQALLEFPLPVCILPPSHHSVWNRTVLNNPCTCLTLRSSGTEVSTQVCISFIGVVVTTSALVMPQCTLS